MPEQVTILDGSTFCVSERNGDIEAGSADPTGLFFRDTRFLSRWTLRSDGEPLEVLSTHTVDYMGAEFFLVLPGVAAHRCPQTSVVRRRFVGDGLHEDVVVVNHGAEPIEIDLRLDVGADFADLFEVKDAAQKKGQCHRRVEDGEIVLEYRRGDFVRGSRISATEASSVDEEGILFRCRLQPHAEWETCLRVVPMMPKDPERRAVKYAHGQTEPRPNMERDLDEWLAAAPKLECDWDPLRHIYRRTLVDLAALRFHPDHSHEASVPAAGLPWFMALFGRDSLITSYQALPFVPELAATTLRVLAARQSTERDDFRDAEPGKILHEIRFGELTELGERPHSPYYGTADATPLFLILLDEYERWTGDADLVRDLEGSARAALRWIDEYGDRDGDGYVEYQTRNPATGLENQCWKDSDNSIVFADGSLAAPPRAVCEIQGYVYDAKRRCARMARSIWHDPDLGERLDQRATELKRRFNDDFWVDDGEFFALAMDGEKRLVDCLTSNIGHLLWSGIVDEGRARPLVRHLMGERLFSGWGVRTMAEGQEAYSPIEYHNGTVWPHDNALIAAGLARYGYREEAADLGQAILEAAPHFGYRLPEVFAGYSRDFTSGFPVEYPTASSPQAWATGTPLLVLRVLLGLAPQDDGLRRDPVLPPLVRRLALRDVPGRWGRTDVETEPVNG